MSFTSLRSLKMSVCTQCHAHFKKIRSFFIMEATILKFSEGAEAHLNFQVIHPKNSKLLRRIMNFIYLIGNKK